MIELDPQFTNTAYQNDLSALEQLWRVRLIGHGKRSLLKATKAVLGRFSDAAVTNIPPDEGRGILSQVLIEIR